MLTEEAESIAREVLHAMESGRQIEPLSGRRPSFTAREAYAVTAALRRIEREPQAPLTLAALAGDSGLSPFHFLRTFRQVAGLTPHQYLLRTRLHRAALRLRRGAPSISDVAYDCGFNDLSTFNRRFRRLMGVTPGAWRTAR